MERWCSGCKKILDSSKFNKHLRDGYQAYCRKCRCKYDKSRKGISRHGITTSEEATRTSRAYRARYPERYLAFLLVKRAIRSGKLKKAPCEKCSSINSLGHHADYSKPLDVNWLCLQHHNEVHGIGK